MFGLASVKLKEMTSQGFDSILEVSVATILLWFVGTLPQVYLPTLSQRHESESLLKIYNERLGNETAVRISIATLLVPPSASFPFRLKPNSKGIQTPPTPQNSP